jgi:predicted phage terminase large subunit-like protein
VTTQGGSRYATSIGGTLTGRGADLIIIDDPLNANEMCSESARNHVNDWYAGALVSRLNDKQKGAIIVVMQRLHEDDLAGHLLLQEGWEHLNLPAIAIEDETIALGDGRVHRRKRGEPLHPEREALATLQSIKAEVGSLLFSAQYLQQPVPLEGNLIRRSWFLTYDQLPWPVIQVVQSWDVAVLTGERNDYSVCTTWRIVNNNAYLAHVYRGRLEYPDLRRKVIALATEHKATIILIEFAGAGMNLVQDLRSDTPFGMTRPIGIKPEGSKADRMAAQAAKIEAGHVYLPNDAPWLAGYFSELLAFPHGKNDDQVDSTSQFLLWSQRSAPNLAAVVEPFVLIGSRHFSY